MRCRSARVKNTIEVSLMTARVYTVEKKLTLKERQTGTDPA